MSSGLAPNETNLDLEPALVAPAAADAAATQLGREEEGHEPLGADAGGDGDVDHHGDDVERQRQDGEEREARENLADFHRLLLDVRVQDERLQPTTPMLYFPAVLCFAE